MTPFTRLLCSIAVCSLALGGPAAAQVLLTDSTDRPLVTASSTVSIATQPMRALVWIDLTATDVDGAGAITQVQATQDLLTAALVGAGLESGAVALYGYGFGKDRAQGMRPMQGVAPGDPFRARLGLRIVVEPVELLGEVMQTIAGVGVESVPLVSLEAGNPEKVRRDAIRRAVRQARTDAEEMAAAAGARLGGLYRLTITPDFSEQMSSSRFLSMGPMGNSGVQLLPTDVTVRVTVSATWLLEIG